MRRNRQSFRRGAFSLAELLVVLAIIGLLSTLLIGGVVSVRRSAQRIESMSQMKQIVLAVSHYADAVGGSLPSLGDVPVPPYGSILFKDEVKPSLFTRILPYVDQGSVRFGKPVALFVSPADPSSANASHEMLGTSSYAANGQVFRTEVRSSAAFRDGASNTITFAEHYSICNGDPFYYSTHSVSNILFHRASFADRGDVVPLNDMLYPPTKNIPTETYQVAPSVYNCDARLAQTPHATGMLVALGDGSVRQISPGISATTYWAAVSPSGGEILGQDWSD
jgi:prepilin-type N-terminal cleavage/methylation domain-containing protein